MLNRRDFLKISGLSVVVPPASKVFEALEILNDRPLNAQTPPHHLHDDITPYGKLFIRNNGIPPEKLKNYADYTLEIIGEVNKEKTYTINELKSKFKSYSYNLVLECAGNGRAGFWPKVSGNQWTYGAIGQPRWTGIRLKDLLEDVGLKSDSIYLGYYGRDTHLSGVANVDTISRGVPLWKALEETSLIAYQMNGEDIPLEHGYPLRLVCPGFPASVSGKWLKRIKICNKVHDGAKMTGDSYKIPITPLRPGEIVPVTEMRILEDMPIKSLITNPRSSLNWNFLQYKDNFILEGKAWSGVYQNVSKENRGIVKKVEVSSDFGKTWIQANLNNSINPYAWQFFSVKIPITQKGYYEFWVRGHDAKTLQPMVVGPWNQKGYINNACMRMCATFI